MNWRNLFLSLAAAAFLPTASMAKDIHIVVTNNEPVQRQELVGVSIDDIYKQMGVAKGQSLVVKNSLGQEVAYQVTYDGMLLIDAAVRPCGKAVFSVTTGKPQEMKVFVTGKMYPERVDDIAWENDRTAYRLYGPALQRSGEKAYGIDVWVKNTPDLEVDNRYKVELANHAKIQGQKVGNRHHLPLRPWLRTRLLQGGSHPRLRCPCLDGERTARHALQLQGL